MTKVTVNKANSCLGHRDCVYALADSGSNYFFSSGGDGMIVKWDLDNPDQGELLAQVPTSVYAMKYLAEPGTLVVAQNFEGLQFIDIKEKKISKSLKVSDSSYFFLETLGEHLLLGLKTGEVLLIDGNTPRVIKALSHSSMSARAMSVHPDGNEFAVGHSDHKIRIFDASTFEMTHELEEHTNSVFMVRYSPNGDHLISGGRDAHLKIWNTTQGYTLQESIVAHMYALNDADFSPNGKHFVTCSMDKSIKVWDYSTFNLIKVIDKSRHAGHGTSVNKLIWSGYNNQIVSCSDDRTISLWDLKFS